MAAAALRDQRAGRDRDRRPLRAVAHQATDAARTARSSPTHRVAELIGQHAAFTVKEALEGRLQAISGAIETLDLQYPDFTKAMRGRYLERLAIGLEEAEYRGQRDQSLISEEVFESLEEDRHSRRTIASERPPLDLGLKLTEMLGKVPIFASLKEDQIARSGADADAGSVHAGRARHPRGRSGRQDVLHRRRASVDVIVVPIRCG